MMRRIESFLLLCVAFLLHHAAISSSSSSFFVEAANKMDFKTLRKSRSVSLNDDSSACTMTLNAFGSFGCHLKREEKPRRGKIARVESEEALEAFLEATASSATETLVVTTPMKTMKANQPRRRSQKRRRSLPVDRFSYLSRAKEESGRC